RLSAEIDHPRARLEEAMPVVDLGQLVGGARTKALALRPRHVGVVELPLEPLPRRLGAALRLAHPDLEVASAAARRAHECPAQALPSRIIGTSMPSRRPRSATRRRTHGK